MLRNHAAETEFVTETRFLFALFKYDEVLGLFKFSP